MIAGDPNVHSVELVAHALGDLCEELILVGGCAACLLIDAPTAPAPRVTSKNSGHYRFVGHGDSMSIHANSEDQLVEQPAIGLFVTSR